MSIVADSSLEPAIADAGAQHWVENAIAVNARRVSENEWDASIAGFDGVCQEQLYTFARERWPKVAQEPVLFLRDNTVVGGCLVMIQTLPLGIGGIAIVKWGPMLARTDDPDALAIYAGMIEALVEIYARQRRLMLSVLPRASLTATNLEYDYLIGRGFRRGATLLFPNRYIVNLRLSDEEIRRSFSQKWRYHLNKSLKHGLSFEHADASRRPEFDALYQAMTDRKKFPDHSAYETVPGLMDLPVDRLRPELFFVRHEGDVVAGAIVFKAGDRAVYLYGATNDRALPLQAGYFLHWEIIRWLRDNTAARWYDLGGTDGFHGLHQFKKGMVGERGVISPVPPVANYAAYPLPFFFGQAAFEAREALHRVRRFVDRLRADRANPDQARPGSDQ